MTANVDPAGSTTYLHRPVSKLPPWQTQVLKLRFKMQSGHEEKIWHRDWCVKEDLCKSAKTPFCQREFQAVRIQEYACHWERGIYVINTCPQPQLALGLSASTKASQKAPQGCQWECCRSIYGFTRKKMLFSVVCQPESLEEGSGSGSAAVWREASSWLSLAVTVLVKQWYREWSV